MKQLDDELGFGAIELVLILVIIGIIGFVGWFVYKNRTNIAASNNSNSSTSTQPSHPPTTATTNTSITPQEFVTKVLASISGSNESQLETYLTSEYLAFRKTDLAKAPCNGGYTNPNFPSTKPLSLFCGSLLDSSTLNNTSPVVTDFTYKDGTKGKSVDYEVVNVGEPGKNYFSFKLVSKGTSWQLSDYEDVFNPSSATKPDLIGMREAS